MPAAEPIGDAIPAGRLDGWREAYGAPRLISAAVVVLLIAAVAFSVWAAGSTPGALVHLLYLPIIVAAIVFKTPGGAAAGILGGIVVGIVAGSEGMPDSVFRAGMLGCVGAFLGHGQQLLYRRARHGQRLRGRLATLHARALSTFASTVTLRDEPTSGHCSRVARNARAIASALDLGPDEVRAVYWAGLLHDLGKIAVPERILSKPAALSEEETRAMREHPDIGARLLVSVSPDLAEIASGVRAHHERWDGSGYPLRARGEAIPLAGRIVAIVDVFEALTCERPYREPRPVGEVLAYIRERAGSWFDPALVPILEDLYWRGEVTTAEGPCGDSAAEPSLVEWTDLARQPVPGSGYQRGSSGRP